VDIQQILRPLQRLEEKLGELYDWIAGTLAEDGEIAAMFHRLSLDERSHAAQVEYQRRLARQNPNHFAQVDLDLAEVFATLDVVHQVRQAGQELTVAKAVRLALELESGAADYHYRTSLSQLNPDVARLMGSLGRADRLHVERLLDLAQRRGLLGPDTPVPAPSK
jgi:rubrerythrin